MSFNEQDGYATPAAAVISLALALVVGAGMARALAELRITRAELSRTQEEYKLAAAHNGAMLMIATSARPPPYRWTIATLGAAVDILAEPEHTKLGLGAVSDLSDEELTRFGVDPIQLRSRLAGMSLVTGDVWVSDADAGATWRACAPSVISPFGRAGALPAHVYSEPEGGKQDGFWRAGEVWRIRAVSPEGWADERIVRLTGNGLRPGAIIARRLSRAAGRIECKIEF
ncbi:hypothetical protein [Phenylobacterium sp.]|uniref:hypothetical protein n=1 Tax=Phenylobacterium sp. TaxID=1871053 RepID=UPI00289B2673|nr:hypothetical protein [Phenylobacterium sp.]